MGGSVQQLLGPRIMYGFMGAIVFLAMIVLVVAENFRSIDTPSGNEKVEKKEDENTHLLSN